MSVDLRKLATDAMAIAVGYARAGTAEHGPNAGDQVEWFQHAARGVKGESWCADFVYACFLKAWCMEKGLLTGADAHSNRVIMLDHADAFSAETGIPRTGYCPTVAKVAKIKDRFLKAGEIPSVGDLALFDFKEQGEPHHIGIIRGKSADGTLRTVEGNTGPGESGSQGDGDGVYLRQRNRSVAYGFVHW